LESRIVDEGGTACTVKVPRLPSTKVDLAALVILTGAVRFGPADGARSLAALGIVVSCHSIVAEVV
jgi:hypothetical protein